MIEAVISEINTRLETLGIFQKKFGICDLIVKDGKTFPAFYCNGQYEHVTDFSKYQGVIYHRLRNDISISQEETETTGCGVATNRTYPLRLVAAVKKDVYKKVNDNAYLEAKIIENIEKVISFSNDKDLCEALNASVVSLNPSGASTDRYRIFTQEYRGFDMFIDFTYAYISVDYNVVIEQDLDCVELQEC